MTELAVIPGWTPERVTKAKKLWAEGQSAAQIAKQIGGGISRNAVLGKIRRLGLSTTGRAKASYAASRFVQTAPTAPGSPVRAVGNVANARVYPPVEPVPLPRERHEEPGSATLLTLGAHMCKWPIGDPQADDFTLCGKFKTGAGPYCTEHHRRSYVSAPGRKGSLGATELVRSMRKHFG